MTPTDRWQPRLFVVLSLLSGVTLVFLIPPFQSSDEPNHYFRTFQVSEGHFRAETRLLPQETRTIIGSGGMMPQGILDQVPPFKRLFFDPQEKTSWTQIAGQLKAPADMNARSFDFFSNTSIYSPVAYAPQALAMRLGRALGLHPLALLYCGRLASVLVWTICGYFTLRFVPALRNSFLLLLLMPMPLFLSAAVSADVMTSALAILLVALLLHESVAVGPMPLSSLLGLGVLSVCLSLTKLAYWPLLFLFFLIPPARLGGQLRYWLSFACLLLVNFAAIWLWVSKTPGLALITRPEDLALNPLGQWAWVKHHPLGFLKVFLMTVKARALWWMVALVGAVGWGEKHLPVAFVIAYAIALVVFAVLEQPLNRSAWLMRSRWCFVAAGAAILLPVATIVVLDYVTFTDLGAKQITGIQGRYFIPLVPVGLLLVPRMGARLRKKWPMIYQSPWMRRAPILIAAIYCVITIAVVCRLYYVY
jgi:uncharacterized membrane protein